MAERKSFVMYTEWNEALAQLPNESAGALLKAIMAYECGEEVEIDDLMASVVFSMVKGALDENNKKYDEKKERMAKINEKKNSPSAPAQTSAEKSETRSRDDIVEDKHDIVENETRSRDDIVNSENDIVRVSVSVSDSVSVPSKEGDSARARARKTPSLEEVIEFCRQRSSKVDPVKFHGYYSARDWTVNGRPLLNWKAKLRDWEVTETAKAKAPPGKHNRFNDFQQNHYDFDALEEELNGKC